MDHRIGDLAIGFVAAAVAVLIFHQGAMLLLRVVGGVDWQVWSMERVEPLGIPAIVNAMFWGGLWGSVFALVWRWLPGGALAARGAVFALIGPLLLGRWLLVPLIKDQALFAGFDGGRMLAQVVVQLAFGIGIGLLFGWLGGRRVDAG